MHGLTLRVRRTVLPRGLKNPPSLTPVAYGEEGRFDTALRAGRHALGHNWAVTLTDHAKASLSPEETRNLNIRFVDSRVFRRGRMSMNTVTTRPW
jgi:hypothetical protein